MGRRYRFMRNLGLDPISAAFIAALNELSNLQPNEVGVMHIVWTMPSDDPPEAPGHGE